MTRALVIGDVHGCRSELDALLVQAGLAAGDQVVFVGDLVGKGPDSRGVVRRARELEALAVRGNHDHRCLGWWHAVREGREPPALGPDHRPAAESLDEDDWAWLASLPLTLRLDEHNVIVVHGGLVPGVPLGDQRPEDLMNLRSIRPDGSPSWRAYQGVPWGSLWPGPEEAVYGHDALRGLQQHPHATGLDTGCVYGGRLTGYLLPERTFVSVPAERVWAPMRGGATP
jgi:diadenosine tetraphosphatase ApaH/serine/threonine PP2A family protein phosphatase